MSAIALEKALRVPEIKLDIPNIHYFATAKFRRQVQRGEPCVLAGALNTWEEFDVEPYENPIFRDIRLVGHGGGSIRAG